jgi:leucyl aminopeptidase
MTQPPSISVLSADVALTTPADVLAFLVSPASASPAALTAADAALGIDLRAAAQAEGFKAQPGQIFDALTLGRLPARRVLLIGCGDITKAEGRAEALQLVAAHAARRARTVRAASLTLIPASDLLADNPAAASHLLLGASLGAYDFNDHRTDPDARINTLSSVAVASAVSPALEPLSALIAAIYTARDLGNSPPNITNPAALCAFARVVAASAPAAFTFDIVEGDALLERGFRLIHAVGRGSDSPPALIHLTYTPPNGVPPKGRVALVGKGVTFDTGGYSLKPWQSQLNMHLDMAGAAAVLATAQYVAACGSPWIIDFFVPTAENNVSDNAYKPMDVIRGYGNKTVEIVNTDAEGRLILADALARAAELKPNLIIDLATLTGACLVALGEHTAAALGTDQNLISRVIAAADAAGEHIWQLPLNEKLRPKLKSAIADMRNASTQPYGGSITAALFLKSWVGDTPWVHLDIAGPAMSDQDRTVSPPGGSGFGVATLVEFLNALL